MQWPRPLHVVDPRGRHVRNGLILAAEICLAFGQQSMFDRVHRCWPTAAILAHADRGTSGSGSQTSQTSIFPISPGQCAMRIWWRIIDFEVHALRSRSDKQIVSYFLSIGERCCLKISDELVVSNSESSEIVSGLVNIVAAVVDAVSVGVVGSANGSSFVANLPVTMLWGQTNETTQLNYWHPYSGQVWMTATTMTTHFMICPGIDTLAESTFRICPLRTLHSIACWMLLNVCGRDRRKLCMLANASMAVPSTTSMTTQPMSDGTNSNAAMCTHMAPPIEWPTIIIGGAFSGYILLKIWPTSLWTTRKFNENDNSHTTIRWRVYEMKWKTQSIYLASVSADKSDSFSTCESPWPRKSIAKHWQCRIDVISVCLETIRNEMQFN